MNSFVPSRTWTRRPGHWREACKLLLDVESFRRLRILGGNLSIPVADGALL
jgi:mannose/cellobiose epimerase-like protein (N-acyl-D-glucosamine 2-epimerase family)